MGRQFLAVVAGLQSRSSSPDGADGVATPITVVGFAIGNWANGDRRSGMIDVPAVTHGACPCLPLNHLHAARHGVDHLGLADAGEKEVCQPR